MPSRMRRLAGGLAFAPTRRLVAVVAIAAPLWLASGTTVGQAVAAGAVFAILIAVALDGITMPSRGAIDVERRFPPNVGVGDGALGRYDVVSRWRRSLTISIFDRLPAAIAPSDGMPDPLTIAAGGALRIERAFSGVQRGDHALGPVAIRVAGRLGLLSRTLRYPLADAIRGIPSVAAVRFLRLLSVQRRMRAPGIRAVRPRGDGRNFANLRDYSQGDDPRHIDWKATARRGKLITREYSLEQGQQILIVVDAGRLMTQFSGTRPRFEYALSSALVLADIAAHSGDAVGVVVFDDIVRRYVAPSRGVAAVRAVREALAGAEATLVEPDYAAAFRTVAGRQRNRALIVLFTDVLDVRSSQTLVAHLALSAARHLPLVVALRNEELTSAALPSGRHTSAAVFHVAAAEELLTAREAALATMRAAGVSVVNVAPAGMTVAVVNRYLDIKARGAL